MIFNLDDPVMINEKIYKSTNIKNFFSSIDEIKKWNHWKMNEQLDLFHKEYGDYQTPIELAETVCRILKNKYTNPSTIIEPTFGIGNFINASMNVFDNVKNIYGIELQEYYFYNFKESLLNKKIDNDIELHVFNDDFFKHKIDKSVFKNEVLILGNPPWVTVSELSKISSSNLPKKENIKNLSGLEAKLGKSNFDIAEYIILKLLELLSEHGSGTLAMLCKTQTAKNIVENSKYSNLKIKSIDMYNFDAKKEFNISASATLLVVRVDKSIEISSVTCDVFDLYDTSLSKKRTFGWVGDQFVSNVFLYNENQAIDGNIKMTWRSGIKHDASKVFELTKDNEGNYINGYNEIVNIEDDLIFNLIKSSDVGKNYLPNETRKYIIVTQKKTGEDTTYIQKTLPKTWEYLNKHRITIGNRRSSIYKGKNEFTIFGVGEYSFAPYKIAISSMYKEPKFSFLAPMNQKTVMLDDTCNFLSFSNYDDALITFLLLNSEKVSRLLNSIVFIDSKRPYTIDILKRIDIPNLCKIYSFDELKEELSRYEKFSDVHLNENIYDEYIKKMTDNELYYRFY